MENQLRNIVREEVRKIKEETSREKEAQERQAEAQNVKVTGWILILGSVLFSLIMALTMKEELRFGTYILWLVPVWFVASCSTLFVVYSDRLHVKTKSVLMLGPTLVSVIVAILPIVLATIR